MGYKPKAINELRTAVKLLKPSGTSKINGVTRHTYPTDGDVIYVNWKTYGGTETTVNGVYSILDTATITTRYRSDITINCRLLREDGKVYEIKSEPENMDLENKYMEFRAERVKGGL